MLPPGGSIFERFDFRFAPGLPPGGTGLYRVGRVVAVAAEGEVAAVSSPPLIKPTSLYERVLQDWNEYHDAL